MAIQRTDVTLIERVYRENRDRLWRALVGFMGDPHSADDALAETFAQAMRARESIMRLDAWVWATAFRIAAGEMQRRRTTMRSSGPTTYEFPEPVRDLVRALGRISPNQRLAVLLHDYADRPTSEIARVMGVTRATVYVHLSQGRKRLRAMLEVRDE